MSSSAMPCDGWSCTCWPTRSICLAKSALMCTLSLSLPLSLSLSLPLSLSHTQTLTHIHSLTHPLTLTLTHPHTLTHTLRLCVRTCVMRRLHLLCVCVRIVLSASTFSIRCSNSCVCPFNGGLWRCSRTSRRSPYYDGCVVFVCICMYVCMYVCVCGCMYVCTYVCVDVCMYVCMCVNVCMYVCMYVWM